MKAVKTTRQAAAYLAWACPGGHKVNRRRIQIVGGVAWIAGIVHPNFDGRTSIVGGAVKADSEIVYAGKDIGPD